MNSRLGFYSLSKLAAITASQLLLFYILGANSQTDVWVLSRIVPIFILSIFSGILQLSWEPIIYSSDNKNYFKLFFGQQIVIAFFFFIAILLMKDIFWDIFNFGNQSEPEFSHLFNDLIIISTIIFLFSSFTLPLIIYLRSTNNILYAEKTEFIIELLSLIPIIFFLEEYGIYFFASIYLFKKILIFLIYYRKANFGSPIFNFRHSFSIINYNFKWLSLLRTVTLSLPLIDKIIVNSFAVTSGTLSIFNLIYTTSSSMVTVFYKFFGMKTAISTCKEIKNNIYENYLIHFYNNILKYLGVILILIFFFYLSQDLFNWILLKFFNFNDDNGTLFYSSLFFILMIFFGGITTYVDSFFYCSKKIEYIVVIGILGAILSLIFRYFLFQNFMIIGTAMAIALHFAVNFFIKYFYLRKETQKTK